MLGAGVAHNMTSCTCNVFHREPDDEKPKEPDPRTRTGAILPGLRVVRGPDWAYSRQDGGEGHAGTVLRVKNKRRPQRPKGTVIVQWDSGDRGMYRAGYHKAFDLRICESAPTGDYHPKIWCDGCDEAQIRGIRWRCTECIAIDLCTSCYMNGRHNPGHAFMRIQKSGKSSTGPKMAPRSSSKHIQLEGIFPGARVVRFPTWFRSVGGNYIPGFVTPKRFRAWKEKQGELHVDFACSVNSQQLLVKEDGNLDLACTQAASGGQCYVGHLPNLGDQEFIKVGDKVLVTASQYEFEKLQRRRGLWRPDLSNVIGREGYVRQFTETGNFVVTWKDSQEEQTINPTTLKKLHSFRTGQTVRISGDLVVVKRFQTGHGGWTPGMPQFAGKNGTVVKVEGMNVLVKVNDTLRYTYHAINLRPDKGAPSAPFTPPTMEDTFSGAYLASYLQHPAMSIVSAVSDGDLQKVKNLLDVRPDWVHYETGPGKSLLSYAAQHSDPPTLKLLIDRGGFIEGVNCLGYTPLMMATMDNRFDNVKCLLENGAEVDATTADVESTALYMAATKGHFQTVYNLLQHGADVNMKGKRNGTSFHTAAGQMNSRTILDKFLGMKETDFKAVGELDMSVLHRAVLSEDPYPVTKILEKVPRLLESTDHLGYTPLHRAASGNTPKAAQVLVKKFQCNLNPRDKKGSTPLLVAVRQGHVDVTDLLVKSGADLNIADEDGDTPLWAAINSCFDQDLELPDRPFLNELLTDWEDLGLDTDDEALVAYLVMNGADLNAPNTEGVPIIDCLTEDDEPMLPALIEIQKQRRQDLAKQSGIPHQLKSVDPKVQETTDVFAHFLKPTLTMNKIIGQLKKTSPERTNGHVRENGQGDSTTATNGNRKPRSRGWRSRKQKSRQEATAVLELEAELAKRDEELSSLGHKVEEMEHLVKKRIMFACGHDTTRSIADLIPECPICDNRGHITGVTDLE